MAGSSFSTDTENADERLALSESDRYPFSDKSAQVDAAVRAVMLQPSCCATMLSSDSEDSEKGLGPKVSCRGTMSFSADSETFEGTTHGDMVSGREVEVHMYSKEMS